MELLKRNRKAILILTDIVLVNISYILAYYIRYPDKIYDVHFLIYKDNMIAITVIYFISLSVFKLYKSLWIYASTDEFLMAIGGCLTGTLLAFTYSMLIGDRLPIIVTALAGIFTMIFIIGFRISFRVYRRFVVNINGMNRLGFQKVMIIGAGYTCNMIINEMKLHTEMKYDPVVVIDDDKSKVGNMIRGVKVQGTRADIERIAQEYDIDVILIGIPSLDMKNKEEIIHICKNTKCKLKTIPGIYELLSKKITLSQIRDVSVEDLLGRDQVKLDMDGISDYIENKTVLVTGGGGSIGSELCMQIAKFKPKQLLILDIYENNAYDLQNELKYIFPRLNFRVIIASVRDRKQLENIFSQYHPNVVFHAAAHKHVPLMEDNPTEAIKNNVFGTLNVAECADKFKANRFILISSDKAVNPTNVMGATKRICEMIVQAIEKKSNTEFVAVRFGNVLGSNGSVIPLFKKQIARGGPITLTHKEITRFFMTIPEAAQLVLQAGAYAKGGEIFVLDMGKPVKMYDLACDLIRLSGLELGRDIEIKVTGLRPGEKLYEELMMNEEGLARTLHEKIFIAKPMDIEFVELKQELEGFQEIIENCNLVEFATKLKEVVPTYVESEFGQYVAETAVSS